MWYFQVLSRWSEKGPYPPEQARPSGDLHLPHREQLPHLSVTKLLKSSRTFLVQDNFMSEENWKHSVNDYIVVCRHGMSNGALILR